MLMCKHEQPGARDGREGWSTLFFPNPANPSDRSKSHLSFIILPTLPWIPSHVVFVLLLDSYVPKL